MWLIAHALSNNGHRFPKVQHKSFWNASNEMKKKTSSYCTRSEAILPDAIRSLVRFLWGSLPQLTRNFPAVVICNGKIPYSFASVKFGRLGPGRARIEPLISAVCQMYLQLRAFKGAWGKEGRETKKRHVKTRLELFSSACYLRSFTKFHIWERNWR